MVLLAAIVLLVSQWTGWASWRRILENRLRPRMLVAQILLTGAQVCLLAWSGLMDGWPVSRPELANPDGGLLAYAGAMLQFAGLWVLFWLTSGLVLGWRREGTRDRKSLAFHLTVTVLSHTMLTVLGPLAAVEWLMRNFQMN